MTNQNAPVISFEGYRIANLEYKAYSEENFIKRSSEVDMTKFKVEISMDFENRISQIKITVNFANEKNLQIGLLTFLGQFKIGDAVTDEEEARKYLLTNGTAIMFPYVRSLVSMITALDKGDVTVLPTFNFSSGFQEE
ncbi:protein-export chaperone SecB [Lentilactobacillus senioris]|nr:protein-export chaperone SecB [Lentilactobacillus senioris]